MQLAMGNNMQSLQNIMLHVVKTTVNILSKAQLLLVLISYNVILRTYTMHARDKQLQFKNTFCILSHSRDFINDLTAFLKPTSLVTSIHHLIGCTRTYGHLQALIRWCDCCLCLTQLVCGSFDSPDARNKH